MTVYVIVSDAGVRDALVLVLEQLGHDVAAFESGAAFFTSRSPGPEDTILVDLSLPEEAGERILRWASELDAPPMQIAISSQSRHEIAARLCDLDLPVLIRMPFTTARLTPWLRARGRPVAPAMRPGSTSHSS
ncbi:response regulator [Breoghania corrubedonensis]|uniref:response regulator n=1 Tax=Breoghania corrubedonensis TaxID=665038 RepID=UPI001473B0C8|nr:response regulator [Breoghania corrubedonensis]